MRNLAIIPARSGSKGLKNKNIRNINGKPLIFYSIEAALNSGVFDKVIVSTDSKEYANIAKIYGAEVPFLRSTRLSGDNTSSWDVVIDILKKYNQSGINFDHVVLLQPTSPLRTAEHIKEAYNLFIDLKANSVVSVCQTDHSPLWSNILPDNNSMVDFIKPEVSSIPRQQLPKYYRINGAIYIVKASYLMNTTNIYEEKSFATIMDKRSSVDIDDETDFKYAEFLIKSQYL